eukprot:CAMPEP_0203965240 /NCGR_PEP_ID=MMETSP0359-20131031/94793_1 /ASSEMBLY_ACC=CAM_ASM_000338 /TAXON_ID=268821 /ORGANISM="Scrippsiella Hangoei, Strain SHTV-5" /LENGTH=54 /DNA_ID=CAMNT_0050902061 /DNA_START=51 /DNA_END=215 /DNA_ORIENTATION=-
MTEMLKHTDSCGLHATITTSAAAHMPPPVAIPSLFNAGRLLGQTQVGHAPQHSR